MVADVDALQWLYLRGVLLALVAATPGALRRATATVLPAAAAVLAAELLVGGAVVPLLAAPLNAAACRRRPPPAVSSLPRSSSCSAPPGSRSTGRGAMLARVRSADRELDRVARRDALVGGLGESLCALRLRPDPRRRPRRLFVFPPGRRAQPFLRLDARAGRPGRLLVYLTTASYLSLSLSFSLCSHLFL